MKRALGGVAVLIVILVSIGVWVQKSELPKYQEAFLYAFGPYEFVRSIQDLSGQRQAQDGLFTTDAIRAANPEWTDGPFLNRHIHSSQLADHTRRSVTTPNNDTLYTSAVLELSATPVELRLPDMGERYNSVALMDVFTDQFAHIGPRETGGEGGTYWIMGPDDTSAAPPGVAVIRAPGNDVWLLARTFVSGQSDLAAAQSAQSGIIVRPVFPDRPVKPFASQVSDLGESENFVAVVNEALARNPDHPHTRRAVNFADVGLGKDATPGLVARFLWSLVTPQAEAAITEQVNRQLSANMGWSVPPDNIGYYGEDDRTRAAIALIGFGALRREDAIYYRMTQTEDGAVLDGTKSYQMILPPDVPAQAFWSIALYEPDETGRFFFYENPTGRHSLNSASEGLRDRADGRVVLSIGPNAPAGQEGNWLPTPRGPFAAFFRVYHPTADAIANGWMPPPITPQENGD